MAAKDERIVVRVADAVKDDFERAAKRDDMNLSTWFRWLGERRVAELHGQAPQLKLEPDPEPEPELEPTLEFVPAPVPDPADVEFVPGFGLTKEN